MPYISKTARPGVAASGPENPGELNYLITRLVLDYIGREPASYQRINDVLGALEGAKLEFYRRYAAPYEDIKLAQNGDVY